MNNQEIWKDVKGYEGIYQISDLGRIKSLDRISKNINGYCIKQSKVINPYLNNYGYLKVKLYGLNINKNLSLHRLIAICFIPNKLNHPCINHKNGIKTDNRISNLEWCTYSYNNSHALRTGLKNHNTPNKGKFNRNHHSSKSVIMFDLNMNYIKTFESTMQIERELNICNSSISACCNGKVKTAGNYIWKYNGNK